MSAILLMMSVSFLTPQIGRAAATRSVCPDILLRLTPQVIFKKPISNVARLDVRRCDDGVELLQIVAWPSAAGAEPLVVETSDTSIAKAFVARGLAFVELNGGPRDFVYVFDLSGTAARMLLKDSTKGETKWTISDSGVVLQIENTWTKKWKVVKFVFPIEP